MFSLDRWQYVLARARERLWLKPLLVCLLSVAGAFFAELADSLPVAWLTPHVSEESIDSLLSIMAASMLVIATFAVSSMVSAYASVGSSATPRAFRLVVADDASQNALSTFIGAFIFSIVALMALKNGYFETAARFVLFVQTMSVFAIVVLTFVRWVDRIARLGRVGTAIDVVETAAAAALKRRRAARHLHGCCPGAGTAPGDPVYARRVGYVSRINIAALQSWAESAKARVAVLALPGTLAMPGQPLARVQIEARPAAPADAEAPAKSKEPDLAKVVDAFVVGGDRLFEDDPRFGLVVLSEIAGRALSPAVNDPGTAIDIIGTQLRLLVDWAEPAEETAAKAEAEAEAKPRHDRVSVPALAAHDLFEDAFTAISRDGAGAVEVAVRLQKALGALASVGDADFRAAALAHGRMALARAEAALTLPQDLAQVREAARFCR